MLKEIQTSKAPQPIGTYSQAISAGGFLFISGQIPMLPNGKLIDSPNMSDNAQQVFENIKAIAEAAGTDLSKTVKLTVYLTMVEEVKNVNLIMANYFSKPYPARVTIEARKLPKGCDIEVDAIIML